MSNNDKNNFENMLVNLFIQRNVKGDMLLSDTLCLLSITLFGWHYDESYPISILPPFHRRGWIQELGWETKMNMLHSEFPHTGELNAPGAFGEEG